MPLHSLKRAGFWLTVVFFCLSLIFETLRGPSRTFSDEIQGAEFIEKMVAAVTQHLKKQETPQAFPSVHFPFPKHQIQVYIAKDLDILSSKPYENWAEDALSIWESSVDGGIQFERVTSPREADIEIYWTSRPITSQNDTFANATCDRVLWNQHEMVHATITISLLDPYTRRLFSEQEVQHLLLHEVGHALGLNHSPDPRDLMYPELTTTLLPSKEDLSHLNSLYLMAYTADTLTSRAHLAPPKMTEERIIDTASFKN